jgi:hypothetical protein
MDRNQYSATEQPDPKQNDKPACWDLVVKDMKDRDEWGRSKYGVPLQPFNGRNAIVDLYQELLDATVYCRQLIEELNQHQAELASVKAELKAIHSAMASCDPKPILDIATEFQFNRLNEESFSQTLSKS